MCDRLLPEPAALAAASDAALAEAISGWAAASAAAEARKLAAIAELQRRAHSGELRERDAIDDTDAAASVVSCALTVTHGKAVGLLDLAVTLRDRLPKVGARFLDGQITSAMITTIAWRTFLVTKSALPAIDTEIAERAPAWGKLSQHGLEKAIDVWVDRHDPDAVRRTRTAMRGRYFAIGDREDAAGGTVSVHGRVSVVDAALMHQRLVAMIGGPCRQDPRTMDQRRADAVGAAFGKGSFFLACQCPDADCKAKVDDGHASSIVIHVIAEQDSLYADPDPECHGEDPERAPKPRNRPTSTPRPEPSAAGGADVEPAAAELESTPSAELVSEPEPAPEHPTPPPRFKAALIPSFKGAIVPAPLLAELIIRGTRIRVIDPTTLTAEPQYRASAALQRFVHARDLTCRFPGCNKPAVHTDIDHTVPWPTGATHPSNAKSYCRLHHLVKTFVPGWKDRQQPDGTVTVTTPAGLTYTTKPLSTLLFPDWNITTPPAPPPRTSQPLSPTRQGRHPRMPARQQTRAENRAAYIATERRLNHIERALEPQSATPLPTASTVDPDDPPPF
ncbi:HNH endonuclease signature motif containing protein [Mycobacterium sp. 236(2023)]|uniref:HNH endonuclease signature motif containing protein n=1 Tax=Mycobacterium sp. 236(2023) TaxID=3038163 RepID=UPI0024153E94|nr:HNH endonuclease signature motif containing protein [Mycobacterium sp. 236(2023)]MDG4663377.1 DUF222 domain-containing protein [Mycobacterium sp. 236(2023)]